MTLRTFPLFSLLFVFILSMGGCKKDDLVNGTMAEIDKLSTEIADTVKNADDKKKGVADAQKLLDGKKDDLKSKMTEIGELRGFQVSEEAMAKMGESLGSAIMKVQKLKIELMQETMKDDELKTALEKLTDDFSKAVEP